jgi:hypothetical protein
MNEERNRQFSPKSGLLPDFVSTLFNMTSKASKIEAKANLNVDGVR